MIKTRQEAIDEILNMETNSWKSIAEAAYDAGASSIPPPQVSYKKLEKLAEDFANKHSYQSDKEEFTTTPWSEWNIYYKAYLEGLKSKLPTTGTAEGREAVEHHIKQLKLVRKYFEEHDMLVSEHMHYYSLGRVIEYLAFATPSNPPAEDTAMKVYINGADITSMCEIDGLTITINDVV